MIEQQHLYYLLANPEFANSVGFSESYIISQDTEEQSRFRRLYKTLVPHCKDGMINRTELIEVLTKLMPGAENDEITGFVNQFFSEGESFVNSKSEQEIQAYLAQEVEKTRKDSIYRIIQQSDMSQFGSMGEYAQNLMSQITHYLNQGRFGTFKQYYDSFFEPELWDFEKLETVSTGYAKLDELLSGGFGKGTLTGFQGNTGGGKSSLLISLAVNNLKAGKNVAYVNLEMNDQQLNARIVSGISSKVSYPAIEKDSSSSMMLAKEEFENIHVGKFCLLKKPTTMARHSAQQIESYLKQWEEEQEKKLDAVYIDYMDLTSLSDLSERIGRDDLVLQRKCQELHTMAQSNNWAVITALQTNRTGFSNNKADAATSIAGSFSAVFDMDNHIVFKRLVEQDVVEVRKGIKVRNNPDADNVAPMFLKFDKFKWTYDVVDFPKSEEKKLSFKNVVAIEYITKNLTQADIVKLCEKEGIECAKSSLSRYLATQGISLPAKSRENWENVQLKALLSTQSLSMSTITSNADGLFNLNQVG